MKSDSFKKACKDSLMWRFSVFIRLAIQQFSATCLKMDSSPASQPAFETIVARPVFDKSGPCCLVCIGQVPGCEFSNALTSVGSSLVTGEILKSNSYYFITGPRVLS